MPRETQIELRSYRVPYGTDPQGFYWPSSAQKRSEVMAVKRGSPADFEAVYQGRPGQREGSIFLESDFVHYEPPENLAAGIADPKVREFINRGHMVAIGWDTAYEASSTADYTVSVPGLLVPCSSYHRGEDPAVYGPCDPHFDVLILDLLREQIDWGGLTARFRLMHRKWEPEIHIIEKKSSGITLYQSFSAIGINVKGVQANESKRARAIEGVGAGSVQGWFRQHRVLFPRHAPWLNPLKTELKDFTGAKDALDDQVDAVVHLVTHAIELGGEAGMLPSEWTPERVDEMMGVQGDGLEIPDVAQWRNMSAAAQTLSLIGMAPEFSRDLFADTCGRCCHYQDQRWCKLHRRPMIALDSCEDFQHGRSN